MAESSYVFLEAIESLISSKIIVADKAIKSLLKAITEEEDFLMTLKDSLINFDFDQTYTTYKTSVDGLPKEDSVFIAFVTQLLFKIDRKELSLVSFITSYYVRKSLDEAYILFLNDFIVSYAEKMMKLSYAFTKEVKVKTNYEKMNEDITEQIDLLKLEIRKNDGKEGFESVIATVNGFLYTLSFNDPVLTKNAFIGMTNSIKLYNFATDTPLEIAKLLKIYGVL